MNAESGLICLASHLWEQRGSLVTWEQLGAGTWDRDQVVQRLGKLLEVGFDVRLAPAGVRMLPFEDTPCCHERLESLGVPTVCNPLVESTNTSAALLAKVDAAPGTLVVAEAQLRGRGRHGSSWFSPAGAGLWWSLLLQAPSPLPHPGLVSLFAGLCVIRVLRDLGAEDLRLKWTNDILWHHRKLCGILVERLPSPKADWYVVGVGINVHQEVPVPQDLAPRCAWLDQVLRRFVPRDQLLLALASNLCTSWPEALREGLASVPSQWNEESGTVGCAVRVGTEDSLFSGTVAGVNEEGALVVHTGAGVQVVHSGRVELVH